jgi:hypothetical protein
MILLLSTASLRELVLGSGAAGEVVIKDSSSSSQQKQFNFAWYVRSGQWRADLRSVAAAIEYLAEPATIAQTNGPATRTGKV